mmetsp:Transcript_37106/g.81529  ORF Transcript_37106/g.81529 Transcript_37106/m.81529 type:complete len:323 (+) Transcript_37106:2290-3258(+)
MGARAASSSCGVRRDAASSTATPVASGTSMCTGTPALASTAPQRTWRTCSKSPHAASAPVATRADQWVAPLAASRGETTSRPLVNELTFSAPAATSSTKPSLHSSSAKSSPDEPSTSSRCATTSEARKDAVTSCDGGGSIHSAPVTSLPSSLTALTLTLLTCTSAAANETSRPARKMRALPTDRPRSNVWLCTLATDASVLLKETSGLTSRPSAAAETDVCWKRSSAPHSPTPSTRFSSASATSTCTSCGEYTSNRSTRSKPLLTTVTAASGSLWLCAALSLIVQPLSSSTAAETPLSQLTDDATAVSSPARLSRIDTAVTP